MARARYEQGANRESLATRVFNYVRHVAPDAPQEAHLTERRQTLILSTALEMSRVLIPACGNV
jgi:hypothetical protein